MRGKTFECYLRFLVFPLVLDGRFQRRVESTYFHDQSLSDRSILLWLITNVVKSLLKPVHKILSYFSNDPSKAGSHMNSTKVM